MISESQQLKISSPQVGGGAVETDPGSNTEHYFTGSASFLNVILFEHMNEQTSHLSLCSFTCVAFLFYVRGGGGGGKKKTSR